MWGQVIAQLAESNQFTFEEDKKSVKITAEQSIIDIFKQNISSRVNTRNLMQGFAAKPSDKSKTLDDEAEAEKISLLPIDKVQKKEVFDYLFKEDLSSLALSKTSGSINWDDQKSTEGTLFSVSKTFPPRKLLMWKTQVQALQVLLTTTPLSKLRSAFSNEPVPIPLEDDALGPVASMASMIIGVSEEKSQGNTEARIFFDCNRLLGLITCYDYTQAAENQITVSKQSLVDFLSVSLPESLALTQPDKKPLIAEPKDSDAMQVPHALHLILDCSGSIGDLSSYFTQVASVVKQIAYHSPDQTIHTTLFDTKNETLLPMRADEPSYLTHLLSRSSNFGDRTYLDGTLISVLNDIDSITTMNAQHNSVLVLTDGHDNVSSAEEKSTLEQRITDYSKTFDPPQFTFVQIGSETNRAFFDRFAQATCASTINLNSTKGFEPLFARIKELASAKGDIRDFLDKESRVLATVRPTLGTLTPLDLQLPAGGFSYGKRGQTPTAFQLQN